MLENYSIDEINGITTIHFSKEPTVDEVKAMINQLAEKDSYRLRLWDFRDVLFQFTMSEIKNIAGYGKSKFTNDNRLAIVAPQDSAYGVLRAFEVYREEDGHSIPRVFRTKQEAVEWLEQQRYLF